MSFKWEHLNQRGSSVHHPAAMDVIAMNFSMLILYVFLSWYFHQIKSRYLDSGGGGKSWNFFLSVSTINNPSCLLFEIPLLTIKTFTLYN